MRSLFKTLYFLLQYRPHIIVRAYVWGTWRRMLTEWRCRLRCQRCGRVFRLIEYPIQICAGPTEDGRPIAEGGIGPGVCSNCYHTLTSTQTNTLPTR